MNAFLLMLGSAAETMVFALYMNFVCEARYKKFIFPLVIILYGFFVPLAFGKHFEVAAVPRTMLNLAVCVVSSIICFKDKLWYKLLCIFSICFINGLLGTIAFLVGKFIGADMSEFYQAGGGLIWLHRLIITIIQYSFALIIIRAIRHKISQSMKIAYYFIGAAAVYYFIALYTGYITAHYNVNMFSITGLMFGAAFVTVLFVFLAFRSINKMHKAEIIDLQRSEQYRNLTEQYEILQKNCIEFRKLRHDFKDHLLVIGSLAEAGETDKVNSYISKLRDDMSGTENKIFCNDLEINTIVAAKYQTARNNGIIMNVVITAIDKINIDKVYLNSILSNIIQNAVENTPAGGNIDFSMNIRAGHLVITCQNDVTTINERLLTTKQDKRNHGYGIRIINDLVKLLGGRSILEYKNNVFCVAITLPIGE